MFTEIPEKFKLADVDFIRMIGSDDLLAMHLINELHARGIDVIPEPNGAGHDVALISEWDTFYGNAFPLTFATMMESIDRRTREPNWTKYANNLKRKIRADSNDYFPENLHTYSYMRGIDGRLPNSESSEAKRLDKEAESGSQWTYTKNLELPIGRGQLDYIRRLTQKLRDKYKRPGSKALKAIGVVGSDVYDKLILFHALREQFGAIPIFTIDIDARMMHHEQFKWTRNVIVASNFGLGLHDDYQSGAYRQDNGGMPPFRDNYQTSLFLACRTALGHCEKPPEGNDQDNKTGNVLRNDPNRIRELIMSPRVFEIGRGRAVDLSADDADIHPPRRRMPPLMSVLSLMVLIPVAAGLCFSLLAQINPTARDIASGIEHKLADAVRVIWQKKSEERKKAKKKWNKFEIMVSVSVLCVILFVAVVIFDHYRPGGEPFSLVAGVSIWPGEALRLISAFLSVYLIFRSLSALRRNENDLHKWFELRNPDEFRESAIFYQKWRDTENLSGWSKHLLNPGTWRRYRREKISINAWKTGIGKKKVEAQRLWREYHVRGTRRNRFHRLIPMSLTYFMLGIILMAILGFPNKPYRGGVSQITDWILLFLSIVSMIILIFLVVDATRLSLRFISNLKEPITRWPTKLIERYGSQKIKETIGQVGHATKSAKRSKNEAVVESEGLAEWLDIKFVAHYTKAVGKLISYPFIVLLIMLVARNPYFDNWDFPISLVIVFLLNLTYALWCAMMLRREAENTRRVALRRLQNDLVEATGVGDECRTKQLEAMIEQVKSIREGAYSPFTENPVLHAILIPSGGISLLTLLKFLPPS
jgi:hypothetical protein